MERCLFELNIVSDIITEDKNEMCQQYMQKGSCRKY